MYRAVEVGLNRALHLQLIPLFPQLTEDILYHFFTYHFILYNAASIYVQVLEMAAKDVLERAFTVSSVQVDRSRVLIHFCKMSGVKDNSLCH